MSIDSLSPLNCVRGQPLEGLQPLTVSVCVYLCVCQWGRRQMAKFTHHISCPCGSTDSRRTEGDRAELKGSGFSLFPPSPSSLWPPHLPFFPPILHVPLSHPPCWPCSPLLLSDPETGSYLNGRGSGWEGAPSHFDPIS